jgi:hypothetical protein
MKLRFLLAALTLGTLSCANYDTLEPLPLQVTITADKLDTVVGDSILFEVNSQGGALLSLVLNYGDTQIFEQGAFGARTIGFKKKHAYLAAGTYQVRALVNDADAGQKSTSINVQIR